MCRPGRPADRSVFGRLKDTLYRKDWVVYAKHPFAGPEQVFRYLGRYTHRVGLSNHRLVSFDEHGVCFRTKDGKRITVSAQEFIRRFLLHVLPDGFVKIRHYGLLASSNLRTKLVLARRRLEAEGKGGHPSPPRPAQPTWQERLLALTGVDLTTCPRCGGRMFSHDVDGRAVHPGHPVRRRSRRRAPDHAPDDRSRPLQALLVGRSGRVRRRGRRRRPSTPYRGSPQWREDAPTVWRAGAARTRPTVGPSSSLGRQAEIPIGAGLGAAAQFNLGLPAEVLARQHREATLTPRRSLDFSKPLLILTNPVPGPGLGPGRSGAGRR